MEKENDNSSSKQELPQGFESKKKENNEAVELPATEVYPIAAYQKFELTGREVEALVKSNPEVLLQLIEEQQLQQRRNREQEFELKKRELDYEYHIRITKEENKLKNEQQNKNIVRFGIGAFLAIFVSALVYSARVDDKNLPNTIITAAISLLAGGSTSMIAFSRQERSEDGNPGQQNSDQTS